MNSSELRGYLTGLVFGDGYIDKGVTKRAFVIRSINKDFIDEIKENLESCTQFNITVRYFPAKYANGCNHRENWELRIKAHPYFAKKYHHFYDDFRNRIASKESLEWLTPHGLANWYMSDGYVCLVGKTKGFIRDRRVEICTDRYSKETIESMRSMLERKFGLKTSMIKRRNTYRIKIKQASYNDFIELISPYIVNSMRYKLYLGYECRPKWMSDEVWDIQQEIIKRGYPGVTSPGIRDSLESLSGSARLKNHCQPEVRAS